MKPLKKNLALENTSEGWRDEPEMRERTIKGVLMIMLPGSNL